MRAAVLVSLALTGLVSTAPVENDIAKRDDFIPYLLEDGCRVNDPKLDGIDRYAKLLSAVGGARSLAQTAVREWWDQGQHSEIAARYLAIPDDGTYKDNEYAKQVHENLVRVGLLDERLPFLSKKIDVHCTDIKNMCSTQVEGTNQLIAGYAVNGGFIIPGYTYDVAFCEIWFRLQDLGTTWETFKDRPREEIAMDWLENDAGKMLHEMMHLRVVTSPRPDVIDVLFNGKRAYGSPTIAKWVAGGAKPADVVQNADSYTQFVNAIYFKNKFGYLPPPERPVPIVEALDCVGEEDQYVDKGGQSYIPEFCELIRSQYTPGSFSDSTLELDVGTAEELYLRFSPRVDGLLSADAVHEQCLVAIPKIFNECDTSSNWKHGGDYTFTQGGEVLYEYQVRPKHVRPSPIPENTVAECRIGVEGLLKMTMFTITGGLWAGKDHGEGLLPGLEECGTLLGWTFQYFNEADAQSKMEWNARAQYPNDVLSSAKSCVEQAIVAAGGPAVSCGSFLE